MTDRQKLEKGGFIIFLAAITVATLIVVSSFLTALLWGAMAAILFQPLNRALLARMPGRPNRAAGLTLLVIIFTVIIPAAIFAGFVMDQAGAVYDRVLSGQINVEHSFHQIHDSLPGWLRDPLDKSGYNSFDGLQQRITETLSNSFRSIAGQVLAIGRNAAAFVLAFGIALYTCFFLLRDGDTLGPKLCQALPMERTIADALADRFVSVVRATIKGSVIVGIVQGALGAFTFWLVGVPTALLWGLLMGLASLLPAVGTGIIWVPMALYLLATGAIVQGLVVVFSGLAVIGMADNVLRPVLVGRDTGIPDYIVLVTTMGGIEACGLSGIVIGPVVAALFITGWQIMTQRRLGREA
jgi:predicted PurR-regulated permease PerM